MINSFGNFNKNMRQDILPADKGGISTEIDETSNTHVLTNNSMFYIALCLNIRAI